MSVQVEQNRTDEAGLSADFIWGCGVGVEQMRKDLAGMLSHDLGNPVLSIQKAMHLLADEALGPMNAGQREVAGLALKNQSSAPWNGHRLSRHLPI
jgi:hypothetical protein